MATSHLDGFTPENHPETILPVPSHHYFLGMAQNEVPNKKVHVEYSTHNTTLCQTNITMENGHVEWENSLFLWPLRNSKLLVITRG